MDKQQILIDLLKEKKFNKDNITGFLLLLETDEELTQMIDWLKENPKADKDAIFDVLDAIAELDYDDEDCCDCGCDECEDDDCDCGCGGEHHHDDGCDCGCEHDHCNYVYVAPKTKK